MGICGTDPPAGCPPSFANGGMTSVSSQASGAQRRPRVSDKGGSRRKNGTTQRSSLQLSRGAAAPLSRRVPPFLRQWRDDLRVVPSFRRAAPSASFRQGRLPPQKWDDTEVIPPVSERRCRADCQRSLQNAPPVVTLKCTTFDGCFLRFFGFVLARDFSVPLRGGVRGTVVPWLW